MRDMQARTDLAIEARELGSANAGRVNGVRSEEYTVGGVKVSRVHIVTPEGGAAMGKPLGRYVTVEAPKMWLSSPEEFEGCARAAARELGALLPQGDGAVLVVGLGNRHITPDALGPLVVKYTMVTRHLKEQMSQWFEGSGFRQVAAMAPGVLGQTGIESAEIIRGVVERMKPDAVIAVDALASRRLSRLASTIQISDTGISPGSGIGNRRAAINSDFLGVPVVSVGTPTVVDAATLACDVVDMAVKNAEQQAGGALGDLFGSLSRSDKYELFREVLDPFDLNLVVTPKEVDTMISEVAKLIAFAINRALHGDVSMDEMNRFVS